MFILELKDGDAPLDEAEIQYLEALGQQVPSFAQVLKSSAHGHLSQNIERFAIERGISIPFLREQMNQMHYGMAESGWKEAEAIAFMTPSFQGDEKMAEQAYHYVLFLDQVGKHVMAKGIFDLGAMDKIDFTPLQTEEDLRQNLKTMRYGDWEVKTMLQRMNQAIEEFNVEYFGSRRR